MTLKLVVWDVQHGSAAYIRTPNNSHIVVDLGTGSHIGYSETFSPLLHLRDNWGVNQLDEVIITHPHLDHIDDMLNLEAMYPRILNRPRHLTESEVWANNRTADGASRSIIQKYLDFNNRYTGPVDASNNPRIAANNGGATIQSFLPVRSSRSNLNNHSIVTVIEYEGNKILLPGDNEPPSWVELLESPGFRDAITGTDILVAPHHGRDSGFHRDLFNYFTPKLTIVSDGPFGDTSATDRYSAVTSGWTVHRRNGQDSKRRCLTTRRDGVIVVDIGRNSDCKQFVSVTID